MKKLLLLSLIVSAACGGDEKKQLFTPKPECEGDAITPYQGTFPQVISALSMHPDPQAAARELRGIVDAARTKRGER